MTATDPDVRGLMLRMAAIQEQLDRLEKALSERAVEPTRSLSVTGVTQLTGLPRPLVLGAIRTGELASIPAGERTKVVRPGDLDAWLEWMEMRGQTSSPRSTRA